METHEKPRVSLADYEAYMKRTPTYAPFSVADILERYIREMNGTATVRGLKPLLSGHVYGLRMLQRFPIGAKDARKLTKLDIIEHCKMRRATVKAATVNQDITYLRGPLDYAGSAWDDCPDITSAAMIAARPALLKWDLIGKGAPRTRIITDEERELLLKDFEEQDKNPRHKIKMVLLVLFGLVSTRRRGEVCRITHPDCDWDRKDKHGKPTPMYWVRDMKHPKRKKGNHKAFPIVPELAEIIVRLPSYHAYMEKVQRIGKELADQDGDRLFPYNAVSVGAKYTIAKKKFGIVNLTLHDNRGTGISHWLKKYPPHKVRLYFSGHNNTHILETVYDRRDPVDYYSEGQAPQPTASLPA